jgi:hypothetical protein
VSVCFLVVMMGDSVGTSGIIFFFPGRPVNKYATYELVI